MCDPPPLCQIFKLMKMDSYRRFVRSPLYQSCTLGGKLLPQLSTEAVLTGSWEEVAARSPLSNKKVEWLGRHGLRGRKGGGGTCVLLKYVLLLSQNRTKSQTPTACQAARLALKNRVRKEAPGEVLADLVLLGYALACILLHFFHHLITFYISFFISFIGNKRWIQQLWFRRWERLPRVCQIQRQCGARLPLQADGGQCNRAHVDDKTLHSRIRLKEYLTWSSALHGFWSFSSHAWLTALSSPSARMADCVPTLQNRGLEVGVGWGCRGWREATAVSICPMAAPRWPPRATANPSKTCWPACVRREASRWRMSSSTFTARRRWGLKLQQAVWERCPHALLVLTSSQPLTRSSFLKVTSLCLVHLGSLCSNR